LTILIVGGSQGSHRLNEIILNAFSLLNPEEMKKYAVIHITGSKDYEWVTETYRKLGVKHEVYPFTARMQEFYGRAGLAVTRAGANTLFELALYGLPALVVPYPFAEGHQAANAEYFAVRHALLSRKENTLTPEWLIEQIREIRNNTTLRESMAAQMEALAVPGAAARLAGLAAEYLKEDLWPSTHATSSEIHVTLI
jgi:UDP-N-acetylglucosamine--N-acetylmuramyl-(pentapeptide) pyrophosphoryl-undecaprenol N-acetylglucosamine transferase